jgi:CheY-like chemotaxis protein
VTRELSTSSLPESVDETDELTLKDFLVLVVDDEIDNTVLLSMDLQQEGYRVITASNGEQAVQVATQTNPDIILMDIGMPELDGLGAARKIRENESSRSVPIIAVTAFGTDGFQRAARDAGFDGFLTKPIDFDRLHELMRRLLPVKK